MLLLGMALPVFGVSLPEAVVKADTLLLERSISSVKPPAIQQPAWLQELIAAEKAKALSHPKSVVRYQVESRGVTSSSLSEFRQQAGQSLNSPLGWARLNISFQEVKSGGQFILVLAEANELPKFSPGCSAEYSCRAGQYVIINQDRWVGATSSWNNAGGSLRDYRHMVINHEVGHWLGHGHQNCPKAGSAAPVMQQQSIDLQGCTFNPWPLSNELSAPTLGV